MNLDKPIFLDFETEAIGPRPHDYPPKPVGVAVYDPETGESEYYTGDNMKRRLTEIRESGVVESWHNGIFDLEVAEVHLGLPWPDMFHDTLILAFLTDCNTPSLSLKALAESWCKFPPIARDELVEWIVRNIPEANVKNAGAYISKAPVELVAKYAIDDVKMTAALFDFCWPAIRDKQLAAYTREIKLLKILSENSRAGIRVDRAKMLEWHVTLSGGVAKADAWIRDKLGVPDLQVSSGPALARALMASPFWDKTRNWPLTPTGRPKTNKWTVESMITDDALVQTLRYRAYMASMLGTYCDPWLELSEKSGRIHTNWNSVRGEFGGTRTGRLSCKPTVQTAPSVRLPDVSKIEIELPTIPAVREWLLPDEGEVLVGADFNAQELRLFAHFEGGKLRERYLLDPRADVHTWVSDTIKALGFPGMNRTWSKDTTFCVLYGGGAKKIAEIVSIREFRTVPVTEVQPIVDAYLANIATQLPKMRAIMRQRYSSDLPFTTLGGRLVRGERPKMVNGRRMDFSYKMINTLIQGSAADMCKEAMVTYNGPGRIWLSAHDELVITCKVEDVDTVKVALESCMCNQSLPLSVPMMIDCVVGKNYSEAK